MHSVKRLTVAVLAIVIPPVIPSLLFLLGLIDHTDAAAFTVLCAMPAITVLSILKNRKSRKRRKAFSPATKALVKRRQGGRCNMCHRRTDYPEYDHIDGRWDNSPENCQMLCPNCHRAKTREDRLSRNALSDRRGPSLWDALSGLFDGAGSGRTSPWFGHGGGSGGGKKRCRKRKSRKRQPDGGWFWQP